MDQNDQNIYAEKKKNENIKVEKPKKSVKVIALTKS